MILRNLVLGACAAVVLAPTAASAERWTHHDAAGDVIELSEKDGRETETALPDDATTDVRRITVAHAARQVRISVRVEDVVRGPRAAFAQVATSEGRKFELMRMQSPDFTFFELSRVRDGGSVACAGKSASIDVVTDMVVLTVPRRCLGAPDWVRVGAGYVTFSEHDDWGRVDDALRSGLGDETLRMSPRVRRG